MITRTHISPELPGIYVHEQKKKKKNHHNGRNFNFNCNHSSFWFLCFTRASLRLHPVSYYLSQAKTLAHPIRCIAGFHKRLIYYLRARSVLDCKGSKKKTNTLDGKGVSASAPLSRRLLALGWRYIRDHEGTREIFWMEVSFHIVHAGGGGGGAVWVFKSHHKK